MSTKTFEQFKNEIDNLFNTHQEEFNKLKAQIDNEASEKQANKARKDAKEKASTNENDTNEGFLKLGEELAEADKTLNTEKFKELKKLVLDKIGTSGASNLNKVIKIAKHPQLQKPEHREKLPTGWGTLAIISTLKECEFETFISDTELTSATPRVDIIAKVNAAKGKEKIKSYTIRIDKNKAEGITLISVEEVKEMLKDSGWELVLPTETTNASN